MQQIGVVVRPRANDPHSFRVFHNNTWFFTRLAHHSRKFTLYRSQVKIRYEDMGLFSSRKEDSDASVTSTPNRKEDKSVIQAIRSRFVSPH